MSDSEHSTVTYTSVSILVEDDSDIGSPGIDGPPIMPEDPYAYIMAAYQVPPSPDYIPGPEVPPSPDYIPGPEVPPSPDYIPSPEEPQSPPLLDFVLEPMYPEYMPHEDEILPAEEQPLPAATSPTADSPGYVPESNPKETIMRNYSGNGVRRNEHDARECTIPDFLSATLLILRALRGVVGLTQLVRKLESVFSISNWTTIRKMPIANAWKMFEEDDDRQNVAQAYAAGTSERKEYAGTLPLCNKCKFYHNGPCTVKCANCKRVDHLTRDCWSSAATNNQRTLTCYGCGNQGHYRSDCPELKNRNHGNQAEGTEARGMVGPFKVLEQVESVAYKLKLPQELSRVHNTFHVSNLKKCYSDDPLVIPLEGLQVDNKLHFVEEPVEIMDREVKQLRRIRVPIVKVRWNFRQGPELHVNVKINSGRNIHTSSPRPHHHQVPYHKP
ncbi:putative reverse transcriptase domain-containing protein [Tanacetum coccineum]